jgi:hypothetical protein
MKDVDVYQDDSDEWVAVTADNTTYYFVNEEEACAFQRGYRVANGSDPMTGAEMKINTTEYTLPAHWASALINGDTSGMEDAEEREMDAWLAHEKPGWCVGCTEEAEFCWSNDAGTLGGDCLTFTFQQE